MRWLSTMAIAWCVGFLLPCATAEETTAAPSSVFVLKAQKTGFGVYKYIDLEGQDYVFKKEPAYAGWGVVRGALDTGKGDRIGFAFDRAAEKLYLDLNRNFDLTDDPDGVFSSSRYYGGPQGIFKIQVSKGEGESLLNYSGDVSFYSWGANLQIHSGWKGDIELQGKAYRLSVADDMNGEFKGERRYTNVFRIGPVPKENEEESPVVGVAAWISKSGNMFIDGHTYAFKFAPKNGDLEATIDEVHPPMGELRLEGGGIRRLILEGDIRVILDNPGPITRVPVGLYATQNVILDSMVAAERKTPVRIEEDASAAMKAGAPLRSTVKASRILQTLQLDYSLVGAGDENYTPLNSRGKEPRFDIARNGKSVCSGAFRYG